jgi:VWFA-related protein
MCLALAAATPTSGGDGTSVVTPPVLEISVVTRVVNVYAIVKDAKGRLVTTLTGDKFELCEDGVPQKVEHFAHETDAPLSLGLLVDTSASQERLLPAERQSAKAFLTDILRPSDRAFVMRFDSDITLLQGLTNQISLITSAIDGLRVDPNLSAALADPRGRARPRGTRLYDAIHLAASELMKGERGRKVLVLLTDGEDQGSIVTRRAALEAAERADLIVYSVMVADPVFYWARDRDFKGEEALAALLKRTGGWLVRPETSLGLDDIAAELRAQYRLGYTPLSARYDGRFRNIDVRLRGTGHSVRARRGYYATAE